MRSAETLKEIQKSLFTIYHVDAFDEWVNDPALDVDFWDFYKEYCKRDDY